MMCTREFDFDEWLSKRGGKPMSLAQASAAAVEHLATSPKHIRDRAAGALFILTFRQAEATIPKEIEADYRKLVGGLKHRGIDTDSMINFHRKMGGLRPKAAARIARSIVRIYRVLNNLPDPSKWRIL